tara:strand:- start:102 stop:293 length:192 start_codon:yes stop_codon:yes gene_type:complete
MQITTKEYTALLQSVYRGKFLLNYITKDILTNPDNVISELDLKYLKNRMNTLTESINEYEKIK